MPISGKSLYIHIPFCRNKCPYCHFYSVSLKDNLKKFIDALLQEIKRTSFKKEKIVSIYFGGGTPSIIEPEEIEEILKLFPFDTKCEITLEVNPEDVSIKRIENYKKIGINRISMGVQSFHEDELRTLKRSHGVEKAKRAIDDIYNAGIENISIDLMYDLPKQNLKTFAQTLNLALDFPIKHISLYNLTFEENTFFYKNKDKYAPFLPKEEESLDLLNYAVETIEKKGFRRYEISAFAKKNFESIHNIGYWTGREFFGFGPSAFSYLNHRRFKNISNVNKYIQLIENNKSTIDFEEKLLKKERIKELLAINLRLTNGVDTHKFQQKEGNFWKELSQTLSNLIEEGFLEKRENQLFLSKKGFLFYDHIAETII